MVKITYFYSQSQEENFQHFTIKHDVCYRIFQSNLYQIKEFTFYS